MSRGKKRRFRVALLHGGRLLRAGDFSGPIELKGAS